MLLINKKTTKLLRPLFLCATVILNSCATIQQSYENYHPAAQKIASIIPHYTKISRQEWPVITHNHALRPGSKDKNIPIIRKRLVNLGDMPSSQTNSTAYFYDKKLKQAVKSFQARHGLNADGVIGESTFKALNVSAKVRLSQLKQSLSQWLKLPQMSEKAYIQVNLASYDLNVITNNKVDLRMKVVVGSKKWPTPTLESQIQSIVVNPTWTIPQNIVEKEIVHKAAINSNYLTEQNIKIFNSWQTKTKPIDPQTIDWHQYTGNKLFPYRLQQTPGDHNALGRIKFTFPNSQHIYLHDTPHKSAFNLPVRNLSHGCIRLENPFQLLGYLLENKKIKNSRRINDFVASEKTKHFSLKNPLPLYVTNITSWVDNKGKINFRTVEI